MSQSYYLDPVTWDRVVGTDGNWRMVSGADQIAQDVACAIRTFAGECWYDTTQGVPYAQDILGVWPPPATSFLVSQLTAAAYTVPTVTAVGVTMLKLVKRQLTGSVLVTTKDSPTPIEVNF